MKTRKSFGIMVTGTELNRRRQPFQGCGSKLPSPGPFCTTCDGGPSFQCATRLVRWRSEDRNLIPTPAVAEGIAGPGKTM